MSKNHHAKLLPNQTSFLNVDSGELPRPTPAQLDRVASRLDIKPKTSELDPSAFRAFAAPALAGVISRLGFSVNEDGIHNHVDIAFRYASLCVQLERNYLR